MRNKQNPNNKPIYLPIRYFGEMLKNNRRILVGIMALWGGMNISYASYSPMIISPNDGYHINLTSSGSSLSSPIMGSDGQQYYRVGSPIVIDRDFAMKNAKGEVKCLGKKWGSNILYIPGIDHTYHRLFIYPPKIGIILENNPVYRINNNIVITVDSTMLNWKMGHGDVCSRLSNNDLTSTSSIRTFTYQFPFTISIYIQDKIIDGQVSFPLTALAGYVRAYVDPVAAPPFDFYPVGETTAPVWLQPSQLNFDASCKTMTSTGEASTVNLRHGTLSSKNYDSLISEKITYTCKFAKSTGVRMRLDYTTDSDPQKRLPMVSNEDPDNKIYSELTLTDDSTGQSGKELKVTIDAVKTISVNSHIKGENAAAGSYRGSAWLIATFD